MDLVNFVSSLYIIRNLSLGKNSEIIKKLFRLLIIIFDFYDVLLRVNFRGRCSFFSRSDSPRSLCERKVALSKLAN